jgi:hypothetical protein
MAAPFSIIQNNNRPQLLQELLQQNTSGFSNVTLRLIGDGRAFGTFTDDPFGLTSGVVLSSGRVIDIPGENTLDGGFSPTTVLSDVSTDFSPEGPAGDSISLEIEFDVDSSRDTLYFQYAFASEEFIEWIGLFNDGFSLQLNGINYATLSNGREVSVNGVAATAVGPYVPEFIRNSTTNGSAKDQLKLDGYTTPFTFAAPLEKNARNQLVINVQDQRDGILDSAVFIKASTLGPVRPPEISTTPFAGSFTVDPTGLVTIDYLFDGGSYQGELALFTVDGLENLVNSPLTFIQEAARRALSNSAAGYVAIADPTEGAKFNGTFPSEGNFNSGPYLGVKAFSFAPGSQVALMFVPNGTIRDAFTNPTLSDDTSPFFSLVIPGSNGIFGTQQFALAGANTGIVGVEDLPINRGSDRDYNDVILRLTGIALDLPLLDAVIGDPTQDWRNTDLGRTIVGSSTPPTQPNNPPINTLPLDNQVIHPDAVLVFSAANGNLISISDADAGNNPLEITLSVTTGTLSLGSTASLLDVNGNTTSSLSARGSLSSLNNALDGLRYTPAGTATEVTLTLRTDDLGNSGAGGPQTDTDRLLIFVASSDAIVGTPAKDNLFGDFRNNFIRGLAGDDHIFGNGGNDILLGEAGNDQLYGASGSDVLNGGADNDILYSNGGNDRLLGGTGNDVIYGDSGEELIDGGPGNDILWLNRGRDSVVLQQGNGTDTINNFHPSLTRFSLGNGLTFSQLSIVQADNSALIRAGNELLATLLNTQAANLTATNFL